MAGDTNTPTRWRLRFSVRTLVVIVTLVCAYAACWGPTKERGPSDVTRLMDDTPMDIPRAISPLLVTGEVLRIVDRQPDSPVLFNPFRRHRCYYFWFFGCVAKLPYERDIETDFDRQLEQATQRYEEEQQHRNRQFSTPDVPDQNGR